MSELDTRLGTLLAQRQVKGRFRSLKEYDTTRLADFSSNDYLSLTTDPGLRKAYISRLSSAPIILGSTGSRLLSGCTPAHSALEARLAAHLCSPSALLFNSGWDANVSFFGTVPQPTDWVVYDELVHASVHSGMRASRVPTSQRVKFAHNDPSDLGAVLAKVMAAATPQQTVFLALESLYSMDGDFAPLPSLLEVMDRHVPRAQQCVVVDEAHSTGVYGAGGRGITHAAGEATNLTANTGRATVRLMTFGKGVGCSGAVLLSSPVIRSFLINFARPFIFSTAMPISTVHSIEAAWDLLSSAEGDAKRANLYDTIGRFYSLLNHVLASTPSDVLRLPDPSPVPFPRSTGSVLPPRPPAPIVGLLSPTPHALSAFLLERGFIVRPVVPPTVPPGGERVRICLRAGMDPSRLELLVDALRDWVVLKAAERAESVVEARAKL